MQGQLSGGKSEEYSMASANSLINLGMIEEVRGGEGDRSGVELKQEKVEKVEKATHFSKPQPTKHLDLPNPECHPLKAISDWNSKYLLM